MSRPTIESSRPTMGQRSYRRQVLLFLVAVMLPSIALVVLSVHMVRQENELAAQRLAETRRSQARDLGEKLLVRLERTKLESVRLQAAERDNTLSFPENPHVAILGWVASGRLELPWDVERQRSPSLGGPEYRRLIREAEGAEYAGKQPARVTTLYQSALAVAQAPAERALARLLLARSLRRQGHVEAAGEHYRELLHLSPAVRDEHGVPISYYAAGRRLADGIVSGALLGALESSVETNAWLSPTASYMLGTFADSLVRMAAGDPLSDRARKLRDLTRWTVRRAEQALALQKDFPQLLLLARRVLPAEPGAPLWIAYGTDPWLVSVDSSLTDKPPLVVAVRATEVMADILDEDGRSATAPGRPGLIARGNAAGDPLGPSFPELRVAYAGPGPATETAWSHRFTFYILALVLVVSITLYGAYLLWWDVRRELNMAAMRSQFVSSVSHELRTPLTAIRMFAELLRLRKLDDPEKERQYLDTIVDESERLSRLLGNVLDFSKIEQGTKRYHKAPTSLSDVVRAAARTMLYPLEQQGFELQVAVSEDLPPVAVDRDAIEQAILNLIANALKYSDQERRIDLTLTREQDEAIIRVVDRGIGIDPKEHERIFQKFYRAPTPENEGLAGAGLGLALVDHIVKAHGGRVDLQSALKKGSTFSIHLPLDGLPKGSVPGAGGRDLGSVPPGQQVPE